MKLAFVYGAFSCFNRQFDMPTLYTSQRGMTGSESSFFSYAREMAELGNEVDIITYMINDSPLPRELSKIKGVINLNYVDPNSIDAGKYDVIFSWNEPNYFKQFKNCNGLRVLNQQLNDFVYCDKDWFDYVDVITSPSKMHIERISQFIPNKSKCIVAPNGVYNSRYNPDVKTLGKVIYASSPDRGLHRLLECWPQIRKKVPYAELSVFYHVRSWIEGLNKTKKLCDDTPGYSLLDTTRKGIARAKYVEYALDKLVNDGVKLYDSISYESIASEMSTAQIFAYPFDPIMWTEGFSVSTMEACAAGTLPVITDADALGEIYGASVPIVKHPIGDRLDTFIDLVVKGITDKEWFYETTKKSRELAKKYEYVDLARDLNDFIVSRIGTGERKKVNMQPEGKKMILTTSQAERSSISFYASQANLWTDDGQQGSAISTHIDAKTTCDWLLFDKNELANASVLNIGTHYPVDEIELSQHTRRWVAIDNSEGVVKRQKQLFSNLPVEWTHCRGIELPFADETFTHVFSFSTIEHIEKKWYPIHLREIARVLAPGGVLCISTHFVEFNEDKRKEYDMYGYTYMFNLNEFIDLCTPFFDTSHINRMGGNGNRVGFRMRKKS
jgi:glycosyltransferase involved in cell wall biosynthesis/SAM-dependent methyltransferase